MVILKCKNCGGDMELAADKTFGTCEWCGSVMTLPRIDDEQRAARFNRGNQFRRIGEFDKALAIYEQILREDEADAEAHWCCAISRFGIEYVEDPATLEYLPTCHRASFDSFLEDVDYQAAVENSAGLTRRQYQKEAAKIAEVQRGILAASQNTEPYDVFICYKESDDRGERTRDSLMAQEIYYQLTEQGKRVFFSRITLEDIAGSQYEPYIFAALNSAKVMVVVGTKPEHFNAVWVKNEWSRFLALMRRDRSRLLLPCYRDMDPYDLPEQLSVLQSYDMSKIGFLQDLVRGVEKLCRPSEAVQQPAVQTVVREAVQSGSNAANLMKRVYLFLEDGDFDQAKEYIGKVLDEDAEYAPAYAASVLVRMKLRQEKALTSLRTSIDADPDWKKALRFADAQQRQIYEAYARTIHENQAYDEEQERQAAGRERLAAEEKERANRYASAVAAMNGKKYPAAITAFHALGDYRESLAKLRTCIDAYRLQLQAEREKKGSIVPELKAAQDRVSDLEQQVLKERRTISEAEAATAELSRREQAIPADVQRLRQELSQVRGLFSGGRKRDLEARIESLQRELSDTSRKKQQSEAAAEEAKKALADLEKQAESAGAALESVRADVQAKALTEWTDEGIIAAAVAAREAYIAQFEVGSTVTMGSYGGEAVEWLVLAAEGDTRMLIAVKGQDAVCFNKSSSDGNEWETSYIRTWLNYTYYNEAFSAEEQAMLVAGPTGDKVWLLSVDEAKQYFANDAARVCYPSAYAKKNGANTDSNGAGWWWLRSPGSDSRGAADVDCDGDVYSHGDYVDYGSVVARPVVAVSVAAGVSSGF